MNDQAKPGKEYTQRIEKALESLSYGKVEIAVILRKLEESIQEEIGSELLAMIPEEKRGEAAKYAEHKDTLENLIPLLPKINKDEFNALVEKKLEKTTKMLEQAVIDADKLEKELSDLSKTSPATNSNTDASNGGSSDQSPAHTVKNTFSNLWKKAT